MLPQHCVIYYHSPPKNENYLQTHIPVHFHLYSNRNMVKSSEQIHRFEPNFRPPDTSLCDDVDQNTAIIHCGHDNRIN